MNIQNHYAQNSEQEIPCLRELIGFDLPVLTCQFPPFPNTNAESIKYILDGNNKALERLRSAAHNSAFTLHHGIEAISDLLITIDLHCPDEVDRQSRIGANLLIYQISQLLQGLSEITWQLEKATAAFGGEE